MSKLIAFAVAMFSGYLLFSQNITVSGNVKDVASGEDLLFATVYINGTSIGTSTNEYGFFSITFDESKVPGETIELVVSYIGYGTIKQTLEKGKNHKLELKLKFEENNLDVFEVSAEKTKAEDNLNSTQMSVIQIPMKQIKTIPSIGGEVDIIKVMQLMPGVAGGTEGTTGMFVRGGDADQNLVLLDEATVYNVGHLFGFFSVFNPDAIKDMTMIKGGFPANYGGRLSSILDIRMNDGNLNKFHGSGGIGLLSSRITLEGPVIKDKAAFVVAARRTYIDQFFKLFNVVLPYYFYDLNWKFNYKISDKDRIFYSGYYGNDVLKFDNSDFDEPDSAQSVFGFGFQLGNLTNTVRWNHIYNDKMFSNVSLITTKFNYDINGKLDANNLLIKSKVTDVGVVGDFNYFKDERTTAKFGGSVVNHSFRPNIISTAGEISEFLGDREGDKIDFQELGIYGNVDYDLIPYVLKVNYGLRLSGAVVKNHVYGGIEPRVSVKYSLTEYSSLKASYSRMKQYMHRVSSSTVSLPTDLWYPVTDSVKPQRADQIAIGYNKVFKKANLNFTAEAYYKWMDNLIEYREGAVLILNDNFESELVQGKGDAYGFEFLLKRDEGRFNGWLGYTLSWSTRDFEELNQGKTYFAKYDRRHDISVVLNYKLSKRWSFSAVWVYSTGYRFTAQIGQYLVPNPALNGVDVIPIYTDRNAVKMSPSHRLDLNFVLGPKKQKKFNDEWHFGCYNFYNRATPYKIEIVPTDDGSVGYKYQQPGLFGFIPSIAYNFKF